MCAAYLQVARLVSREGLSQRNHHFLHAALVGMGLDVRALLRTQLNVGDEQIRDHRLHRLQGWSERGEKKS